MKKQKLRIQPVVAIKATPAHPHGHHHSGVAASTSLVITTRTGNSALDQTLLLQRPPSGDSEEIDGFAAQTATQIVAHSRHSACSIIVRDHLHLPSLSKCSTCGGLQERRYKLYGPIDISLLDLLILSWEERPVIKRIFLPCMTINLGPLNRISFVERWIATPSYQEIEGWFESVAEVRCPRCSDLGFDGERIWNSVEERHGMRKFPGFRVKEFALQAKYRPEKFQLLPKEESLVWQRQQKRLASFPSTTTVSTS